MTATRSQAASSSKRPSLHQALRPKCPPVTRRQAASHSTAVVPTVNPKSQAKTPCLTESRVRQAGNDLKGKKPAERAAASSDADGPSPSPTAIKIWKAMLAFDDWSPHFAKKQVAKIAFFTCPPGDIRNHAGEREEKYRDLYDDMAANTQLWMNFLDDRRNYNHAENICGILVRLCISLRL